MGGFGSGRYPRIGSRSRYLVADRDVQRLDIRELYKDGLLDGDARGTVTWFRHGKPAGSIGTYSEPCEFALRLDYEYGSPPMSVREKVNLWFTACNYGGDRPWFLCPACGRRCAILWGRRRFLCRRCQGVAYASQKESASSRAIRRVHEIRAKLMVGRGVPVPCIPMPRYMRYERYRALVVELAQHEALWSAHFLGLIASVDCVLATHDFAHERLHAA